MFTKCIFPKFPNLGMESACCAQTPLVGYGTVPGTCILLPKNAVQGGLAIKSSVNVPASTSGCVLGFEKIA